MPVHDWTKVEPDIFHDIYVGWFAEIGKALNNGGLPGDYYALVEQHAGSSVADLLTLGVSEAVPLLPAIGAIAVAGKPPRVQRGQTIEPAFMARRRTLAIRHVSGHRLVGILEIVSTANKDRALHVKEFVAKVVSALDYGVHVLLVDLFPPGPHDPHGLHEIILRTLEDSDQLYDLPAEAPLTLASYAVGPGVEIHLTHVAVGATLPEMPLFLRPDRYVNVPLESTYQAAYQGMPSFWRKVLEGA